MPHVKFALQSWWRNPAAGLLGAALAGLHKLPVDKLAQLGLHHISVTTVWRDDCWDCQISIDNMRFSAQVGALLASKLVRVNERFH